MLKLEMLDNYKGDDLKNFNNIKTDPRLHNISELALRVMYNRGLKTVDDMEKHLFGNVNNLHDPFLLPDCDKFCEVVADSIRKGEKIINYTDYDADGIGSSITTLDGIRHLIKLSGSSSTIDWYANNRFIEGYGITVGGIDDLLKKHPDVKLIITTDNGIVAFDAIKKCNKLGIKVVITDHHQTLKEKGVEKLPKALAVVDPHRMDSKYPFKNICGAGVMFKLLLALTTYMGYEKDWVYDLLDVVGLATVGDMMPILDENRIFLKESLKSVREEKLLAFKALRLGLERDAKNAGKTRIVNIDEELYGFTYCPMLNALGRLQGSIDKAMELFETTDESKMDEIVDFLILNNEDRKRFTEEQTEIALEKIDEEHLPDVIVVYDECFMEGIVGLIAGRLKEKYNRPTIAFAKNGDSLKASARSIDGVNMIESLLKLPKKMLIGCGGHAGAAGLRIEEKDLEKFTKKINSIIKLTADQKNKHVYIDAAMKVGEISEEMIDGIEMLKPFGQNFEKPRFGLQQFIADIPSTGNPYRGKDGETIRLVNNEGFTVLMFNGANRFSMIEDKFEEKMEIKCIGYPAVNVFNNKVSLQFKVEENLMF